MGSDSDSQTIKDYPSVANQKGKKNHKNKKIKEAVKLLKYKSKPRLPAEGLVKKENIKLVFKIRPDKSSDGSLPEIKKEMDGYKDELHLNVIDSNEPGIPPEEKDFFAEETSPTSLLSKQRSLMDDSSDEIPSPFSSAKPPKINLVHTYDSSSNSEDKLPKLSTKSVEPVVDSDNNSNQSQSGGIFSFLQLKKQSSKTEKVKERKKVALTTLSTIPSQLTYKSRSNSPDRPGIKLKITSSASKSAQNECFNPFLVDESKPDNDDQEEQPSSSKTEVKPEKKEKKKASVKHKRKLEKALRKCGKKIQDLEEAPI